MVAVQIAHEPLMKQTIRQIFYERAKIQIVPTRKGKKVGLLPIQFKRILYIANVENVVDVYCKWEFI